MQGLLAALEKGFLEGYAASELNVSAMFLCICLSAVFGLYVYAVYRSVNKNAFYNRSFGLSLIGLTTITASIILTIQSNIIVSLGMVGALSIVRFRTAIKDPMALVFLFWSISVGIICGAGFAMIAVIASVILTLVIVFLSILPAERGSLVLVVNTDSYIEREVLDVVREFCRTWKVRARTTTRNSMNLAIEIRVQDPAALMEALMKTEHVLSASIVEHDGEVSA